MIRRLVLLVLCSVSSVSFLIVSPSEASSSDRCVDTASGSRALLPPSGSYFDQKSIDDHGRLVVLETTDVGSAYSDRLVRFLSDGSVDTSFGTDGAAVLPGRSLSFRMRNVRVDPAGRIWTMRATYSDEFEVQRFLENGELDPVFERYLYHENGELDPIGDIEIAEDGVSLHIAFGRRVGDAAGGAIQLMTIYPDSSSVRRVGSGYLPGVRPTVIDVSPEGWVAGGLASITDSSDRHEFGWHWFSGFGNNIPYQTEATGTLYSIQTFADGRVIAGGYARVDGQTDGLVVHIDPGPDPVGNTQTTGFGVRTIDFGGEFDAIAELLPDGTAVMFGGDSSSTEGIGFGSVGSDGYVAPGLITPIDGESVVPVEARLRADGRINLAGFGESGSAWQATFTDPSPEFSDSASAGQIQRLYAAYFLREPDQAGLAFWLRQRAMGTELESVSNAFAAAPEFISAYGELSDDQFVALVYRNVLRREGGAEGRAFWVTALASGMVRGQLMVEFSESSENVTRTGTPQTYTANAGSLFRLYRAYFDRDPDAAGACFWIASLDAGTSLASVSESFASSREFSETYGALSDSAFVELIYRNVLGRTGDTDGIDYWTNVLVSGFRTRGEVLVGFSESPEYINSTGTLPRQ